MILTKEQIELRTENPNNVTNQLEIRRSLPDVIIKDGKNHIGRPGSTNLTDNEKVAISVLANTVGNEVAAELFGISENTARHLRSAQTTIGEGRGSQRYAEDTELRNKVQKRLDSTKLTIQERAAETLLTAMGLLTEEPDKLKNCSVKELADVTTKMSQVVRNISGGNNNRDNDNNRGPKVNIVLHQPKQSREDNFDIIEIGVG